MKLVLLTLVLIFSGTAFGSGISIIEKTKQIDDSSKSTIQQGQIELLEDIRKECGPIQVKALDVVEMRNNHYTVAEPSGGEDPVLIDTVTVKAICQ